MKKALFFLICCISCLFITSSQAQQLKDQPSISDIPDSTRILIWYDAVDALRWIEFGDLKAGIGLGGEDLSDNSITELQDVIITAPGSRHFLFWDGATWVNGIIIDADLPATITRDTEWNTIAKIEAATGVDIITSSELGEATSDDQTATEVPFDFTVGISAINVQAAIEELDAEKQPLDAELSALSGVSSSENALPYFTGVGTAAVATLSPFARTLIDDVDAATSRTTLGLVIGTDVQPYDATPALDLVDATNYPSANVDHDATTNFVADEHIDWTSDQGATNIAQANVPVADAADALSANGANCSAGQAPLGVDETGAVEGCFDVATQTELDAIAGGHVIYDVAGETAMEQRDTLAFSDDFSLVDIPASGVDDPAMTLLGLAAHVESFGGATGAITSSSQDTFTVKRQQFVPVVSSVSGSYTPDFRAGNSHVITVTGNIQLENPRLWASEHNATIELHFQQDIGGENLITEWGSKYTNECQLFDGPLEFTTITMHYIYEWDVVRCSSESDNYTISPLFAETVELESPTANYVIDWDDPAAPRALTIPDPGGADTFVFEGATQTFTNKTISGVSNTFSAIPPSAISVTAPNAQVGTTYTFVLADANRATSLTNGAAITATIPPNSTTAYPLGAVLNGFQGGAGPVTVAPGAGVTVNALGDDLTLSGQWAAFSCIQRVTNSWVCSGGF